MDILKIVKSKSFGLIVSLVGFSLFCIFVYLNSPTKESQKEGSISLYYNDQKAEIIGTVQRTFKGGHNVPFIMVDEKEFSVDDTTFYKLTIGDSIYKEANSDLYFIFRKNVLIDSSNIRDYYLN